MSYKINTEMHHVIDLNSCEFIDRKQKFQSFIKSKHVIHLKKGAYYKQEVEHNNKYIRAFPYYDDMGYSADFYEFFGIYYLDKYLKSEAKLTTKERWEKEINEEK